MAQGVSDRRGFLRLAAALAAGGAGVSVAGPALALQARPLSDYGAVLEGACGATREHARLVREAEQALGLTAGDPRMQAVLRGMTCPSCGCALLMPPAPDASGAF